MTQDNDKIAELHPLKKVILPDAGPIKAIHRHTESILFLAPLAKGHAYPTKDGPKPNWFPIFAARPQDLDEIFPDFIREMMRDSYFTVNAYSGAKYQAGRKKGQYIRAQAELTRYCMCFSDIDCDHVGIPLPDAIGAFTKWEHTPEGIPTSYIVFSGHGFWPIWILASEDDGTALPATSENVGLYHSVQGAIHKQFIPLGACAHDATRVIRVPESKNTGAKKLVKYQLNLGNDRILITYTLQELAAAFNANPMPRYKMGELTTRPAFPKPPSKTGRKIPANRNGWEARYQYELDDFTTLVDIRGGLREHTRYYGCLLYASWLRKVPCSQGHIYQAVIDLVKRSDQYPPFTQADIDHAIASAYDFLCVSHQQIAEWLHITEAESARLKVLPYEGYTPAHSIYNTRSDLAELRRIHIEDLVEGTHRGRCPSLRTIARYLESEGHPATIRTISRDLKAMGIKNPRANFGDVQGEMEFENQGEPEIQRLDPKRRHSDGGHPRTPEDQDPEHGVSTSDHTPEP